jgi:sialate O-acetylesterase
MRWIYIFLLSVLTTKIKANIRLPRFVSNGMVLQRDLPIKIWGWADAGEKIQITFKGKQYSTVAGADSKWNIQMDPAQAGGPYVLIAKGKNTIQVEDILMGDVWFCSGQSNMEYELYKAAEKYPNEIASSTNDQIRQFQVKRAVSFLPLEDVETERGWEKANPTTVGNFSAIAYFYGRQLFEKYKVPIGLINSSYGGTPAEAWMSEAALKAYPHYAKRAQFFKDPKMVDSVTKADKAFADSWLKNVSTADMGTIQKWYSKEYAMNDKTTADWGTITMPSFWQEQVLPEVKAGIVWFKKEMNLPAKYAQQPAVLRLGNIIMRDVTYVNGIKVGTTSNKHAPRKYSIDKNILQAGSNTITVQVMNEMGDAGFIKDKRYQLEIGDTIIYLGGDWKYKLGIAAPVLSRENTTKFHMEGTVLYNGMVNPCVGLGIKGVIWYQGEANQSKAKEYRTLFPDLIQSWRAVWGLGDFPFLWVQLANINKPKPQPSESKLAELQDAQSHTLYLPNTGMAVINDIGEWNDIHPMNKLDAAHRLYLAGLKVAYHENNIVYAGPTLARSEIKDNTIILYFTNIGSGLVAKQTGKLNHFAIADESRKYVWADAIIDGDKVIVKSKDIPHPVYVRYAWADNPVGANLYNKEGLPASCFSTEKK